MSHSYQDSFTGLSELRRLNLTANNLWSLPESAFCHLGRLRALNLSQNHLQDPRDLGFARESRRACRIPIRTLDLSHNGVTRVPAGAFGQLSRLSTLLLSSNGLTLLAGMNCIK